MAAAKRRVIYVDLARCEVGERAQVYIKGQGWFSTSPVVEIMPHCDGPVFETRNSIYWPAPTDGSPIDVYYQFKETNGVPHFET